MNWLNVAFVLRAHQKNMRKTPLEDDGVRDNGRLLESVLMRPQNLSSYEHVEDVWELASAYCVAIATGHAFNNGNKRTALTSMISFLAKNNCKCRLPDTDETVLVINQVAEGKIGREELTRWLKEKAIML